MTEIYGSGNVVATGNGASLSSIYQARKSGERTVNVLKKQFQNRIETRIGHEEEPAIRGQATARSSPRKLVPPKSAPFVQVNSATSPKREGREVQKLNREKSFDEARTAVQSQVGMIKFCYSKFLNTGLISILSSSLENLNNKYIYSILTIFQIERIFQKAAAAKKKQQMQTGQTLQGPQGVGGPTGPGFTMHGVSHLTPDDVPIATPLPVHHGITLKVRKI